MKKFLLSFALISGILTNSPVYAEQTTHTSYKARIVNCIKTDLGFGEKIEKTTITQDFMTGLRLFGYTCATNAILNGIVLRNIDWGKTSLQSVNWASDKYMKNILSVALYAALIVPIAEETVFTYGLSNGACKLFGQNGGEIISSLLFGAVHFQHENFSQSMNHAILTGTMHLIKVRNYNAHRQHTWAPLFNHIINNTCVVGLFYMISKAAQ